MQEEVYKNISQCTYGLQTQMEILNLESFGLLLTFFSYNYIGINNNNM